jgi:hypothetical protein
MNSLGKVYSDIKGSFSFIIRESFSAIIDEDQVFVFSSKNNIIFGNYLILPLITVDP